MIASSQILKDRQYYKFCLYGFLKNLRFFDAFFILFLLEKGITFTQIGLLYAAREIVSNVFELPSGILADALGRKRTLAGSFLLYISSFILFYLFGDFWLFLLAFTLFGLGEAFRSGTHKGMIMDYLELQGAGDQAANYYGHTRSWSQKGSALSALTAGFIVLCGGSYHSVFLYSTIPYLLNFLLIMSYPECLNHSTDTRDKRKRQRIGYAIRLLFQLLKKAKVRRIIYSSATHSAYLAAVKDYIQIVMLNLAVVLPFLMHLDPEKKSGIVIGVLYFLIFLSTSLASKYSSLLAGKSKGKLVKITMLAGFAFGMISGMAFNSGFWIISLLAFTGIYVGENIRKPMLTGAIADQVPKEILTSIISAQTLLKTIITSLLALVFGLLADHLGVGLSLAIVSSVLMLIYLVLLIFPSNPE